jgi:CDP-diglyceride synthetase
MKKRILSVLITVVMMIGMLPTTAFAADSVSRMPGARVETNDYGDVFLGGFGMEMTTDAFTHYLIFYFLYVWAQMALYWWKRNEVCVTYAHAYMELLPKEGNAHESH